MGGGQGLLVRPLHHPRTEVAAMFRNQVHLGRIFGIQIGLDYSWFLIVALLTWLLAVNYYPGEFKNWSPALYWIIGAATAIMLFVSVLLHELGHSAVAIAYGVPVRAITLFIFGGVSQIEAEPPSAGAEFLIAIAGPLVSAALGGVFYGLEHVVAGNAPLWGLTEYLAYINIALAVFNLIPGYPLDGGRVFRAIVWAVTKNLRRATLVAANVGRLFGFLFIFFGVLQVFSGNFSGGIWIAIIGWFLESAATAQSQQVTIQGLLAGHRVSQAMRRECDSVPAETTLQQLVDEHVLGRGTRCLLVKQGTNTVGLVTLHGIKEIPRSSWSSTTVAQTMVPLERLKRTSPDAALWTALEEMDHNDVNQLPVLRDHQVVGILSREDVIAFLRTLQAIGS
jgi:Zn-dependent protease